MRIRLLTAALAVTLGLAACTHMPAAETRHSGFLSDYSRLVDDPVWSNSQYWVKPGLKAAQQYDKVVLLEPAVFHANEETARAAASRGMRELVSSRISSNAVNPLIVHGDAVATLLDKERELNADLIVLTRRNKSLTEELLLESVTSKLLERSRCDVLVMH